MSKLSPEDAAALVRAKFGDVVVAKPVRPEVETDPEVEVADILTKVCYFYPQYTLETAEDLTDKQARALLFQAEKQRAIELYNQTLIAAAPHTKKGKLVKKLIEQYKEIAEL